MKQRLKATPASYLILKRDNEILMHLRQNSGFMDGHYSFVAGHLEPREGPTECIIREAKEEGLLDALAQLEKKLFSTRSSDPRVYSSKKFTHFLKLYTLISPYQINNYLTIL